MVASDTAHLFPQREAAASIAGVTTLSPNYGFPQNGKVGDPGFRVYADAAMVSEAHPGPEGRPVDM
jgi:hypothetical protein